MAGGRLEDETGFWRLLSAAADVAGMLWSRGWAERNAGNLSCDVTELVTAVEGIGGPEPLRLPRAVPELAHRRLLVTAAGSRLRDVANDPDRWCGVVEFTAGGAGYRVAWASAGVSAFSPTSEIPAHLAIHAALRRRDSTHRAVVHTHPAELLALSHDRRLLDEARLNALLWAVHPEAVVVVPAGVALVPYALPGSQEQGDAAGAAMERHEVALWEKHGAVATGTGFAEAFDLIDTVNAAARLLLLCRAAGFEPEGLSPSQVADLRRAYPGSAVR